MKAPAPTGMPAAGGLLAHAARPALAWHAVVPFSTLLADEHNLSDRGAPATVSRGDTDERRPERAGDRPAPEPQAEPRNEPPCVTLPVALEVERPRGARPTGAPPELPVQQLADRVLRQVSICQLGGQTSMRMEISTPRLPRVGLQLSVEAGRLTARFSVPDPAGRDLLRSAMQELEAGLGQRGLQVEAIEIDAAEGGPTSGDSGSGKERRRGGQQRRDPRPRRKSGRGFVL